MRRFRLRRLNRSGGALVRRRQSRLCPGNQTLASPYCSLSTWHSRYCRPISSKCSGPRRIAVRYRYVRRSGQIHPHPQLPRPDLTGRVVGITTNGQQRPVLAANCSPTVQLRRLFGRCRLQVNQCQIDSLSHRLAGRVVGRCTYDRCPISSCAARTQSCARRADVETTRHVCKAAGVRRLAGARASGDTSAAGEVVCKSFIKVARHKSYSRQPARSASLASVHKGPPGVFVMTRLARTASVTSCRVRKKCATPTAHVE